MNKYSILCTVLSTALFLSACQGTAAPVVTDPAAEPPVSESTGLSVTAPDITPVYESMYSIALPVTTEDFFAENQELIYSYSYQTIYPACQDRDVADKIIMNFTDRIEKKRTISNDILSSVQSGYQANTSFIPNLYEVQYNVTRIDQGVLSMFGHAVQIGDTPRATSKLQSVNYNMVTGDVLTVGSILYHLDTKDDLAQLAISNLEKRDDILLFDDFKTTVSARFDRDESTDEDFYFSNNGLCFYFAPSEIASRSYGTVVVEIPYSELTQIISDDCFPAERSYTNGNIKISKFSDADLDSYQQFIDVVADEKGTKLLLTTDTAVQDIRIYELIWTQDGLAYTQTKNIYATNFLSSENAILLEGEFSSFRPSFLISYAVDGKTVTFYTVANETTGEITLETIY